MVYSKAWAQDGPSHSKLPELTTNGQAPEALLINVVKELTFHNQQSFRLVCKSWYAAQNAADHQRRIVLPAIPGWEASAQEIRDKLPYLAIVLCTAEATDIHDLVNSPLCDSVVLAIDPEVMSAWECDVITS